MLENSIKKEITALRLSRVITPETRIDFLKRLDRARKRLKFEEMAEDLQAEEFGDPDEMLEE